MLDTLQIQDIDRILDELEAAAQSEISLSQVIQAATQRLQFLFNAKGTAFFFLPYSKCWTAQLVQGEIDTDAIAGLLPDGSRTDSFAPHHIHHDDWIAVPIRRDKWEHGTLVVQFQKSLDSTVSSEAIKLCEAVGEIVAFRQIAELEQQYEKETRALHKSFDRMTASKTRQDAVYSLVNDLAALTSADRVSFLGPPGTLVVSGAIKTETKSDTVLALGKLCKKAIRQEKPEIRNTAQTAVLTSESDVAGEPARKQRDVYLNNYLCLPLISHTLKGRDRKPDCGLLFEWDEYEAYVRGCGFIQRVLPGLFASWRQTDRLLAVPSIIRKLFSWRTSIASTPWFAKSIRWGTLIGLICVLVWGLNRPTPFRIEVQGTLQPAERREVFSELDGIVTSILVEDGQQVACGEPLLVMRSPQLEIQLQEVIGEKRALAKKRDGLELTVNQLQNQDRDLLEQSRISSEIEELNTRLETLSSKEAALREEERKLSISAPIDGTVAGREIERRLRSRPVRRGDALMRIVRFDGEWQLELLVPDVDSGYVRRRFYGQATSPARAANDAIHLELDYVIASQPDRRRVAHAKWMAGSARNPDGDGVFVDLIAKVGPEVAEEAHRGATVYAYIDCGLEPFWYVWSRPLIEFFQRKLWF